MDTGTRDGSGKMDQTRDERCGQWTQELGGGGMGTDGHMTRDGRWDKWTQD